MMTKNEAKEFLEEAKTLGSILGLESIRTLLSYLNNPQENMKYIHVAGTNGKGSITSYLTSVLTKCGVQVGTFTSPAVFDYRERFMVCNQWIQEDDLLCVIELVKNAVDKMVLDKYTHPTVFEIETAMAFVYFKMQQCDIVVLEVGMGGSEDSTNIISNNLCSVFASIGMDHMQFLGNTLEEIATCKAGIIKPNCPAVSSWQEPIVENALTKVADMNHTNVTFANRDDLTIVSTSPIKFNYKSWENVQLSMQGTFQIDNCCTALEVIDFLIEKGTQIKREDVLLALNEVIWHGRMECISKEHHIYIDGAHNFPAAVRLRETLQKDFTNKSITYIIGVLKDKEYEKVLDVMLPMATNVIVLAPENERALDADILYQAVKNREISVEKATSYKEAVLIALQKEKDMILAFGSLSYLADIKKAFIDRIEEQDV